MTNLEKAESAIKSADRFGEGDVMPASLARDIATKLDLSIGALDRLELRATDLSPMFDNDSKLLDAYRKEIDLLGEAIKQARVAIAKVTR